MHEDEIYCMVVQMCVAHLGILIPHMVSPEPTELRQLIYAVSPRLILLAECACTYIHRKPPLCGENTAAVAVRATCLLQ